MSTTHDLSEIWKALRTAWLADAELVALLGAADAIYRDFPQGAPAFPIIVLDDRASNPIGNASFTGLWRPDLQVDIFSVSDYTNRAISGKLQQKWTVPLNKTAAVESTNFRITELRNVNDVDAGTLHVIDTGQAIRQLACEWRARVIKKTA